jgi:hypothetical protein
VAPRVQSEKLQSSCAELHSGPMKARSGASRWSDFRALRWYLLGGGFGLWALAAPVACDEPEVVQDIDASSGDGGSAGDGSAGTSGSGGVGGEAGAGPEARVEIAIDVPLTVSPPTALGVNYWSWARTYGANLSGTEDLVKALKPALIRIGGHNNDNNTPDVFDEAEIDRAITYARAVGAEPILQVPLLLDGADASPTADTAAAMVRYVNVTKQYGVKYFSIGNEPDIYSEADQRPLKPNYTPDDYCASVADFAPAMRAVDPSIQIVGPELSWQYETGANDWLTPILVSCGSSFDIVTVHRYPLDPSKTTIAAAEGDALKYKATLAAIRGKMAAVGMADKPLAVTESNITWNGDPAVNRNPASAGTVPAGMWLADITGVGLESNLWAFTPWSIREGWTLGFLVQNNLRRPSYWAYEFWANHRGPNVLYVQNPDEHVHLHATRDPASATTYVIALNFDSAPHTYTFAAMSGASTRASADVLLDPVSMTVVDLPDNSARRILTYSDKQWKHLGEDPVER